MPHRANSTSFKPGISGNPSGRPKKTPTQKQLEQLCRENAPKALSVLMRIMTDSETSARDQLKAIELMFDRGFGKAVGRDVLLRLSGTADPTRMSDAQLLEYAGMSAGDLVHDNEAPAIDFKTGGD
jgi:hypothetical protein